MGTSYENELGDIEKPEYSDNYKKNINNFLNQERCHNKKKYTKWIKVASVFCIFSISSTVFMYNANENWRYFINRIFSVKDTHVNIGNVVSTLEYDFGSVSEKWDYFYIPNYLTLGYRVDRIESSSISIVIQYSQNDEIMTFLQNNDIEKNMSLDNEQSTVSEIKVGEYDGYYISSPSVNTIFGDDRIYAFSLSGNIDEQELIFIAESLKVVNN